MFSLFLRKALFSSASLALLSAACFLSSAFGRQEATPAAEQAKPSADPVKSDEKPAEAKSNDPSEATEKISSDKREEKAKASREKLPPKKQLRQLALSGSYDDLMQPPSLDPASLIMGQNPAKSKSFFRLCEYIQEMADDENVTHVLFDLSDTSIGFNSAQLDELTRRLVTLKTKAKKTIAWLEDAGNIQLAIAVCCDEIIMADFGGIDMPSSAMETMFYRDAMDLVGVKASVVRAGDFKGAVEPYTNPTMSDHLKQHYLEMLESINAAQVSRIAKGRGLTNAAVRELQKKRMLLPTEALAAGLVTKLAPYGSMKSTIQDSIGKEIEWTKPKAKPKREMSIFEVMSKAMAGPKENAKVKDDSIAILHLSGAIVDGKEASPGSIVAGPTVKSIEELIHDDRIKGVVVRVNSPGGSATASEAIRQALDELARKKPVVVSMGEMAASGGYWVSCIGQPIYAERGTITGSIGVFSLKISMGSLLRRVGVHVESVTLDDSAASNAINRAWSDNEISNMQRFIDDIYGRFLKLASKSRNIPVEKLQTLAGGRVWSGEQAKLNGLIDEIGGVDDCIAVVAKKANSEKYKVIHRPEPASGFDLFRALDDSSGSDIAMGEVGMLQSMEQKLFGILSQRGFRMDTTKALLRSAWQNTTGKPAVWALMPQEMRIH
ncbi:MAG: signal peptide peptidase SppA [Planctomycetota bacterium]|nr:signal peptide peptidase SppA [Planctomycetota bacterium]